MQTEMEVCSGSTTPSIPADPLTDDGHLMALRQELQVLGKENVSLKFFVFV
jgi:hypothetical protein